MIVSLAQVSKKIGEEPLRGFGSLGLPGVTISSSSIQEVMAVFNQPISTVIGVMTIIAGIWFIFNFIIGVYGYLTAGGNQESLQKATAKISQSLIGLVIIVAAYAVISLIGSILGLDVLNPQDVIELLGPNP